MIVIRITFGSALLSLFLLGAGFNVKSMYKRSRGEHYPSILPLLPGLAGAAGFWVLPFHNLSTFAWLPLLLDYGCLPYFLFASLYLIHEAIVHSSYYLVGRFRGTHVNGTVSTLSLYRNGDWILEQQDILHGSRSSMIGSWQQETDMVALNLGNQTTKLAPVNGTSQHQWTVISDSSLLDGVDLHLVRGSVFGGAKK